MRNINIRLDTNKRKYNKFLFLQNTYSMAKRLDSISILRVCCIIAVVFFHCYGMMYASGHFPETASTYKDLYYTLTQCVFINVAMSLFVFISGYLFIHLLQLGKYPTWGNLLRKKGLRILVPYFVFGLFFMATTGNWHPLRLFNGGYWHLWFLPMLFWSFIAGYGIYKIKLGTSAEIILLLLCFFGTFTPQFLPMLFGLQSTTRWFYWFYLGIIVFKYKDKMYPYLKKYKLFWLSFTAYGMITYFHPIGYGENCWYGYLAISGCLISIIYLMAKADLSKIKLTNLLLKFSSHSFGIYILHNWVALMLISSTMKHFWGLAKLAANHIVLFPFLFSVFTLLISLFLSYCIMKTKIGKFLIG